MFIDPRKPVEHVNGLFDVEPEHFELPELEHSALDDAFDEMELFGFTLRSPFDLLKEKPAATIRAAQLPKLLGKEAELTGHLVTVKYTKSSDGRRMCFGTFLDTDGQWLDTVHFPDSAARHPFAGPGCYTIRGRVAEEFDFVYVDVSEMKRLPMLSMDDVPVRASLIK